ncbi:MAG TPA: heavy-metal-associated domain-containing protein [Clostridiaceae bacterium]|jgi:copper ion binding protein|nr:heavy-metal-associated domain-containing protein [Clostridiaceae bacterium]
MIKKISIEGMSCQHCVNHVKNALEELDGIRSAKVSLENKSAEIELSHDVDNEIIESAIEEAGYEVTKIQ